MKTRHLRYIAGLLLLFFVPTSTPAQQTAFPPNGAISNEMEFEYHRSDGSVYISYNYFHEWRQVQPPTSGTAQANFFLSGNTSQPVRIEYHRMNGEVFTSLDGAQWARKQENYLPQDMKTGSQAISPGSQITAIVPNPTNRQATISYRVVAYEQIALSITDQNGLEVSRLVDEKQEVGIYSVSLNACDLKPGVYLCKLASEGNVSIKSLVIAK